MRQLTSFTPSDAAIQITRFPFPLRPLADGAYPSADLPSIPTAPAHPRFRQRHGRKVQACYPQLSYPAARAFFHAGGTLPASSSPVPAAHSRPHALATTERVADFIGAVVMFGGFYGLLLVT